MKKKLLKIILSLLVLIMLTSCQPTPETEAVAKKQDIINSIKPIESGISNESDEYWNETVTTAKDNVFIDIDCKIEVQSDVDFPVKKVAPLTFDAARVIKLIDYLAPDCRFYKEPYILTREQIEDKIVMLSRGELIDGEYVVLDSTKKYIEELKKELEQMTDEKREYVTPNYIFDNINSNIEVGAETTENKDVYININNKNFNLNYGTFMFSYGNLVQTQALLDSHGIEIGEGFNISEDDAKYQADKVMEDLGIEGFTMSNIQKAQMYNVDGTSIISKGYQILYMRKNEDLETIFIGTGASYREDALPDYCAPWEQESVSILIDEFGLQKFSWRGLSEIKETISESAEILPYEKILDRIKQQLKYKFSWIDDYEDGKVSVKVQRIVLGTALIDIKDNPNEGLLVPCWYVLYEENVELENGQLNDPENDALVINAIDGSVIEPRLSASTIFS